jgi:hypothetical protein
MLVYTFDIAIPTVSEKDESIVFHEERYIRTLLRNLGVSLKPLKPGTFLKTADQQWVVSIAWDGRNLKWQAQSAVSGFFFTSSHQTIKLVHGHGAREECERILRVITTNIPMTRIVDYNELKETVLSGLKMRGYSKTSPECELRIIERSESIFRYGAFLADGTPQEPFFTHSIEAGMGCTDAILEEIATGLNEGEALVINIKNIKSFMEQLSSWLYGHIKEANDEFEGPLEYEVTLSIDKAQTAIIWVAETYQTEGPRTGVLYDDFKALLQAGIRAATREVREIFELDVVSQLGAVSNLDEVLKTQIPDMIRCVRELNQRGK